MSEERLYEESSQGTGSGEVCPGCDEEITVSPAPVGDQLELTCRCGCSLAAA